LKSRKSSTTSIIWKDVADKIVSALKNPATSVEAKKLELGRQARQHAIESFREYSQVLEEEDIERAAIRAVE
jgi:hypothetical protein